MTTNNLAPPPRRRARTIAIVVAAVVLGLVIGLVVVGVARHNGTGGQATSTTAVTAAPATTAPASSVISSAATVPAASTPNSVDGVSGSLADGCLGGADAFTAILAAQKAATPDNNGAAAFAQAPSTGHRVRSGGAGSDAEG